MSADEPAVAVCDPRILAGAIVSDESAYRDKNVAVRMVFDSATIPILTNAALLFDTPIGDPVLMLGLEPILGHSFLDVFGDTISKIQKCGS